MHAQHQLWAMRTQACLLATLVVAQQDIPPNSVRIVPGGVLRIGASGRLQIGVPSSPHNEFVANWTGWSPTTGPVGGSRLDVLSTNVDRLYTIMRHLQPAITAEANWSLWDYTAREPVVANVNNLFVLASDFNMTSAGETADWMGCCDPLPPALIAAPSPPPSPSSSPSTFFQAATTAVDRLFEIVSLHASSASATVSSLFG